MALAQELLHPTRWTLAESRATAHALLSQPRKIRQLIAALFSDHAELRLRAADTARRLTEKDPTCLRRYADELIGLLADLPEEHPRTRWHMALVASRSASTSPQRLRLAPILLQWLNASSNEVRCCALEGLGLLAIEEPSLRPAVRAAAHHALTTGTPALSCRSRQALKKLSQADRRSTHL